MNAGGARRHPFHPCEGKMAMRRWMWSRCDVRPGGRRWPDRRLRIGPALAALVSVVSIGSLVLAAPASAEGNGKFSLSPASTSPGIRSIFTPTLTAGVPLKDEAAVENLTAQPITLNLYAADGYTNSSGGFSLQPSYAPKLKMGVWIHLPVSSVKIAPSSGYLVPFTYAVPANEPPGDYAGGIVAVEATAAVSKKGHVHTRVLQAVGVAVYGKVAGPLFPRVGVTSVSIATTHPLASQFGGAVDATVTYSVTNTGNETLKPAVTVTLSPLLGSDHKIHVQMPEILPGSTVTYHHNFGKVVPYGSLSATVTAHALGVQGSGSTTVIIVPWLLVAIVVVLLILLALYIRRRRRRNRPESQPGETEPGDTPPGSEKAAQATPNAPVKSGAGARGP